jgi:hypothetical protein
VENTVVNVSPSVAKQAIFSRIAFDRRIASRRNWKSGLIAQPKKSR